MRSGLIYSFLPSFSRNIFDQCQTTLGSVQSKEECSVLLLRTRYIFGDCPRSNSFWFLRVYGQLALLSSFPWTPIVVCVLSSTKLFLCVGSLPYLCESPSCHRGPGRGGGVPTQALIKPIWVLMRTPFLRSRSSFYFFLMLKLTYPQCISAIKPNL